MSTQVEERVVSMQFDNSDFEKNVKTSMSTLDKLKYRLQAFKNGADDIAYFTQAFGQITFNKFQQGAEMSIGKILRLTAALTGVVNISDQLYNTVTSTFRSLSVDQITRGWSKYEEKTEADGRGRRALPVPERLCPVRSGARDAGGSSDPGRRGGRPVRRCGGQRERCGNFPGIRIFHR